MSSMKFLTVTVVAILLSGSACLFSPDSEPGGQSNYYSPADTPEKLLFNFQLAYQTQDIDAYKDCLHDEFEFILLEVDWDDYDGDGIIDESWGRDIEEDFTANMFASSDAEVVELTLNGTSNTEWYGDPTGETRQLVRTFDLKVYYWDAGTQTGFRAMGTAVFRCKPDESGEYKIWQWEDHSET